MPSFECLPLPFSLWHTKIFFCPLPLPLCLLCSCFVHDHLFLLQHEHTYFTAAVTAMTLARQDFTLYTTYSKCMPSKNPTSSCKNWCKDACTRMSALAHSGAVRCTCGTWAAANLKPVKLQKLSGAVDQTITTHFSNARYNWCARCSSGSASRGTLPVLFVVAGVQRHHFYVHVGQWHEAFQKQHLWNFFMHWWTWLGAFS